MSSRKRDRREEHYVALRFEGNNSKEWDGKEVEVPEKMADRLGEQTAEGLKRAHVHWPGKGGKSQGKTWHCVLVPPTADTSETVSALAEAQMTPRQASSRGHQEEMETLMTGIYMILASSSLAT